MREIRTSGSTRGQWLAGQPSPTVLLYRPNALTRKGPANPGTDEIV